MIAFLLDEPARARRGVVDEGDGEGQGGARDAGRHHRRARRPSPTGRPPAIRAAVEAAAVTAGLVNDEGQPQLSKAQGPVRVATTGRSVGPPLFESLEALGRERTLARLRAAAGELGAAS